MVYSLQDGDRGIITQQLGRQPRNLVGVARRCPAGNPRVIVTHPLFYHDGVFPEIFPTLYWLTCPRMVKEVSRLEGAGAIEEIQQTVFADSELSAELAEAHRRYAEERRLLVSEVTRVSLRENYPAQYEVLVHSGVGGIMDAGIKCLHTHYADYLVNGQNPVGRLVAARLGDKADELCQECAERAAGER